MLVRYISRAGATQHDFGEVLEQLRVIFPFEDSNSLVSPVEIASDRLVVGQTVLGRGANGLSVIQQGVMTSVEKCV